MGLYQNKYLTKKTTRHLRSIQIQGAEVEGKGAYLKYMTEPVLRQVQQPSKVTWLLGEVEAQQLGTCKTPPCNLWNFIDEPEPKSNFNRE